MSSSIKHITLPGDHVSTCVMEFADEADENYDPYKVFQENMDDINKKQVVTPLCKPVIKFDWIVQPSCHINFSQRPRFFLTI